MSAMFCYQCEETVRGEGCTRRGVCGKQDTVANLQDLLIHLLKGISVYGIKAEELEIEDEGIDEFIMESLFATITNVDFSEGNFLELIDEALALRADLKDKLLAEYNGKESELLNEMPAMVTWTPNNKEELYEKAKEVGVNKAEDEDIASLRSLLLYGLKGLSAYADHAYILGKKNEEITSFLKKGLVATSDDSLGTDDLLNLVMKCGEMGVEAMSLLSEGNTEHYGHPEPTEVELGTRDNPGILISGHDLLDLEELLEQTKGTGVDVYTHGEMLPAQAYPVFKEYDHFAGNYGNAWWQQKKEFEKFNGPILMTTNCLVPPKDSYKDRVYTTGVVGFNDVKHISDRENGEPKDFSEIIESAQGCPAPQELETGTITNGFGHNAVVEVADKVVEAVENGAIKQFFVMGGCDGRHKEREYYTEFARALPEDTVILTAGCAKYRYNKLDLGDIGGIPRVLDAGQCNDSYSLVVIAKKLAEAFDLEDVNELPITYNIAWYEQKAVLVLLALLSLGIKNIHLGPKLPAFLSENVLQILIDEFDIKPNTTVEEDLEQMLN